jgi:hypothetical protein
MWHIPPMSYLCGYLRAAKCCELRRITLSRTLVHKRTEGSKIAKVVGPVTRAYS